MFFKRKIKSVCITTVVVCHLLSCNSSSILMDIDSTLNLKWNKAYEEDTIEKSLIGLKWGLSYLGASLPANDIGIIIKNNIITVDLVKLGFDSNAKQKLQILINTIKKTAEYQKTGSVDLGRFVTLSLGASEHYYEIVGTSIHINDLLNKYTLLPQTGYVNNSTVALEHRIVNFSEQAGLNQVFISKEIDSLTGTIHEYETIELLPNGQLRYGIYNSLGRRIPAANAKYSNAGKPAKCMWCHESTINPMFTDQTDYPGFLPYTDFQNTLMGYRESHHNSRLDLLPNGVNFDQKQAHTLTELLYISFMEPSVERLSNEWNLSIKEIENLTQDIPSHAHEEFPFLGKLFHREDIKNLSPFESLEVSSLVREKSEREVNHLY